MSQRLHTAIVEFDAGTLTYQYMCQERDRVPPLAIFRQEIRLAEMEDLASRLASSLGRKPDIAELRESGGRLYDRLIPRDLAEKLSMESERSYLVLYLDPRLAFVPWEVLFDGKVFLCERFHLSRQLEKSSAELREAERKLQDHPWGRGILILFGDIRGLEAAAEKSAVEDILTEAFGNQVWFYAARTSEEALELLKQGYDVCHFIGHGVYAESSRAESGWRFPDGSILSVEDLERVSSQASFPRLIFANSCVSASVSAEESAAYISTLHRAFLSKGVPHYIGTVSRVPDAPSVRFSSSLYAALASGTSIGEGISHARETLRTAGEQAWACYVAYGDPTYRLISEPVGARLSRAVPVESEAPEPQEELMRALRPRFVDRTEELAEACAFLEPLRSGRPAVLLVSGDAGAGKTAFLEKVVARSQEVLSGIVPIECACNLQVGIGDPYMPFRQIFSRLYRSGAVLREPKAKTVGEFATHEVLRSFPYIASIFPPDVPRGSRPGETDRAAAPETISGYPNQATLFDQVRKLFDRIASMSPLVIAVDNLHWADESSISLFYHVASGLHSPVFLIGTYRPQALARSGLRTVHPMREMLNELRRYGAHTVSLDYSGKKPQDQKRLRTFVSACVEAEFPEHRLPQSFVENLALHTGGNALFITELLKYARDKGKVVFEKGRWKLVSEEDFAELPESIEALIENRITDIAGELREMLTLASVEGEDFTAEVLARLQNLEEDKVLSRIVEDLYRMHRLVEEAGEREVSPEKVLSLFHFQNTLIQQRLYKDLSLAQRRRLHKKVGDCLEALYGGRADAVAGQLAAHFRIAREHAKALRYALKAAESAASMYAYREAIRFYQMALELAELAPEKDLTLKKKVLYALAEMCKDAARFPDAKAAYEGILQLDPLDRSARGYALNGLGDIHRVQGYFSEALPYYEECEAIAREISDEKLLCEVWTDLTNLSWRLWLNAMARGLAEERAIHRAKVETYGARVLSTGEALQAWNNLRRVYETYGNVAVGERNTEQAEYFYGKALALAEERKLVKKVLGNLGEVRRLEGRYKEALSYYRAYLDWALKTGATRHEIIANHNIGMVYVAERDFEQARDFFDRSIQLNTPVRSRTTAALARAMKGYTFEAEGARDAAFALYRQSISILELESAEEKIHQTIGRMLLAYEPQAVAHFLTKYLEQEPEDAEAIRQLLRESSSAEIPKPAVA